MLTSPIIMTGVMKPEYYIRKRVLSIFDILTKFQMAQKQPIPCPDLPRSYFVIYVKIYIWQSVFKTEEIVNGEVDSGFKGTFSSISLTTRGTKTY